MSHVLSFRCAHRGDMMAVARYPCLSIYLERLCNGRRRWSRQVCFFLLIEVLLVTVLGLCFALRWHVNLGNVSLAPSSALAAGTSATPGSVSTPTVTPDPAGSVSTKKQVLTCWTAC